MMRDMSAVKETVEYMKMKTGDGDNSHSLIDREPTHDLREFVPHLHL